MRKPSACSACRARRRRCTWPANSTAAACEYCTSRRLRCVQEPPEGGYYHKRQSRLQEPGGHGDGAGVVGVGGGAGVVELPLSPNQTSSLLFTGPQVELPPMPLRLELATLYFDYIHDQFHSLFHRPSFMDDVAHDRVAPVLLLAIFALSARFSSNPLLASIEPRDRGEAFRLASESLLKIRDISTQTCQVCILLGGYAAGHGDTDVENLYYTLAGRMALTLDFPNKPASSSLEREINIRIWWTICMVDVWSSTAVKLPKIMPNLHSVPLPMDELPFLSLPGSFAVEMSESPPTFGSPLLSQMIKLNRVLAQVNDFNRRCVEERLEGAALEVGIQSLSLELERWLVGLPYNMRDTPENFAWFASRGLGRVYAAVYLGYYHYGQLLYYQFLGADATRSMSSSHIYADRCKDHAAKLCDMVYQTFDAPGSEVLYAAVAHVIVIASTVQIHTLLFSGDEMQIRLSRTRLERNFEILLQLRPYWSSVDSAMSRLRAFHQTCLRRNKASFVLDKWLVRFLVEFAPYMESEPRDTDPDYEALWSLSKEQQHRAATSAMGP
ncbi:fungal-specific transcription factor domain-containing protein [Pestalotiopsis sp. NC0098]|nr:fungal-specific transcription factor domain-containing protein [Pestalotiopsis sp. NC0098]